jgi:Protein of unknown function (DUF2971)
VTVLPEKLYRYRPCLGPHFKKELEHLALNKVWLSPLADQNDPFEGRPHIVESNEKDFKEFLAEVRARFGQQAGFNGKTSGHVLDDVSSWDADAEWQDERFQFELAKRALTGFSEVVPKETKIACFSKNEMNPLMWAHCGSDHRGACFEFELKRKPRDDDPTWGEVTYIGPSRERKTRSELSYVNLWKHYFATQKVFPDDDENTKRVTSTFALSKSEDWAYEKEWRIYQTGKPDGYVNVPLYRLSAVILGLRTPSDIEAKLKMALGNKVPFKRTKSKGDAYEFYIEDEA